MVVLDPNPNLNLMGLWKFDSWSPQPKSYPFITKTTCGSMDRASAYKVKGSGFDPYWAQVSIGGFLTACISLYSLVGGTDMICPHLSEKRKPPTRTLPCARYWACSLPLPLPLPIVYKVQFIIKYNHSPQRFTWYEFSYHWNSSNHHLIYYIYTAQKKC